MHSRRALQSGFLGLASAFVLLCVLPATAEFDRRGNTTSNGFDRSSDNCERSNWRKCDADCSDPVAEFSGFLCRHRCLNSECKATDNFDRGFDRRVGVTCLEEESETCVGECKPQSFNQARCRRDCLTRRCSSAGSLLVAEEAAKPGTLYCRRCKKAEQKECNQLCGVVGSMPDVGTAGLGSFACRKVCISARCGADCLSLIPGL